MVLDRAEEPKTAEEDEPVDAGTRSQIAEFLRMTPAQRLESLSNTVAFIQRSRVPSPRWDR